MQFVMVGDVIHALNYSPEFSYLRWVFVTTGTFQNVSSLWHGVRLISTMSIWSLINKFALTKLTLKTLLVFQSKIRFHLGQVASFGKALAGRKSRMLQAQSGKKQLPAPSWSWISHFASPEGVIFEHYRRYIRRKGLGIQLKEVKIIDIAQFKNDVYLRQPFALRVQARSKRTNIREQRDRYQPRYMLFDSEVSLKEMLENFPQIRVPSLHWIRLLLAYSVQSLMHNMTEHCTPQLN